MSNNDPKKCFVIMPYGDKPDRDGEIIPFDDVYEYIIKKVVERVGLQCIRSDEVLEAGWIHSDMLDHIYRDEVAIVDITTLNPNVFYELGVRHALKPSVTVLIRKKDTPLPFNLRGLNFIDYDLDVRSASEAQDKIEEFIRNGLKESETDSLVYEVFPDLRVSEGEGRMKPRPLSRKEIHEYRLKKAPDKQIALITGDIRNVEKADIWVNSENTNMQMSRFHERSISSIIRYQGARKDKVGNVTEDVVADELADIMGANLSVNPATVLVTGAGELEKTHNVKRVFHVASVQGEIGYGYRPIHTIEACVRNALAKADSQEFEGLELKSILFPLLGTGEAEGDLKGIAERLLGAAISYLETRGEGGIDRVYFLAYTDVELETCQAVLDASEGLVAASE